jgi:1-deoxy-D-xylulose-5-phosphate reductoisomerase
MRKKIAILGSTGSIGKTTLKIIEKKVNLFEVNTLIANKNFKDISIQIKKFKPKLFLISDKSTYLKIKKKFPKSKTKFINNFQELSLSKKDIDITISAIPGIKGLEPTIIYVKKSKKVLLANKESVICGWNIIKKVATKYRTKIIPIDSEHFSIYKLLQNHHASEVKKIYITASGGPFLNLKKDKFKYIKPKNAIRHPKWNMGKKISVDSATLMNKILELIEANKIFNYKLNDFKIIIHPQSLVHAIIKFKSGITKFLYHEPDMSIPIANAIFDSKMDFDYIKKNNIDLAPSLDFFEVDEKKFPIIGIIPKLNKYISTPIVINAANEILVDQFLKKKISFNAIISSLFLVLKDKNYKKYAIKKPSNLNIIYEIDQWSRNTAKTIIENN